MMDEAAERSQRGSEPAKPIGDISPEVTRITSLFRGVCTKGRGALRLHEEFPSMPWRNS